MNTQTVQEQSSELADMMEERVDIKRSPMMDYHDAIVKKVSDKKYLFGYLADDEDPENPLTEWDGVGRIYSAHRDSDTQSELQEALGLDSNWEPDLGLTHDFPAVLRKHWIAAAADDSDFQQWCHDEGRPPRDQSKLAAYYLDKAKRFWRETGGCDQVYYNVDMEISDFDTATDLAEVAAHEELLEAGKIGDVDRVVLDCYQHSGVAWSISGEGMQCRFDTASGAGVWVPDDCTREEIQRRGEKVYAFGSVVELRGLMGGKRKPFLYKLDDQFGGVESMRFDTWSEAFEAFQGYIKHHKLRLPKKKSEREACIERGRTRARVEIARSGVELYNDYLNGNVFGIVIATFEVGEDGEPVHIEDDSVWGFFGDDDAYQSLKEEIAARDD